MEASSFASIVNTVEKLGLDEPTPCFVPHSHYRSTSTFIRPPEKVGGVAHRRCWSQDTVRMAATPSPSSPYIGGFADAFEAINFSFFDKDGEFKDIRPDATDEQDRHLQSTFG